LTEEQHPGVVLPAFHGRRPSTAKSPIKAFRADPVTAAQDAVLADSALFGLIGFSVNCPP
jgi:hypothetical protein